MNFTIEEVKETFIDILYFKFPGIAEATEAAIDWDMIYADVADAINEDQLCEFCEDIITDICVSEVFKEVG